MEVMDEAVVVSLRVRPMIKRDLDKLVHNVIQQVSTDPKIVIAGDRGMAFDHVFIDSDQETVYEEMMRPIVNRFLQGINCTVLAYGQTGTGKTYTMGTEAKDYGTQNDGLIFRAMETVLSSFSSNPSASFAVSFIEVYNEEVYDLLPEHAVKLDSKKLKFKEQGFSHTPVETLDDVVKLLGGGTSNRHTRATALNDSSSRSHAIFTVYFNCSSGDHQITSKLNLVDLAGSEGVGKTGNQGQARQEGISINQGLLVLGNVIQILSSKSKVYVPYRNSLLTSILQDCLQERNMVAVIACVSPSHMDIQETVNTMRFAEKAKKVICKAEVNRVLKIYKAEHSSRFAHIGSAIKKIPCTPNVSNYAANSFVTPAVASKRPPLFELNGTCHPLSLSSTGLEKSGTFQKSKIHPSNGRLSGSSVLSSTVSDISTSSMIMSSTISPIIRQCYEKIEDHLDDKITTIVRTQLKRPSVQNAFISYDQNMCIGESDECWPTTVRRRPVPLDIEFDMNVKKARDEINNFMRDQIKLEIKHLVKNEIFTALNTQKKTCAPLTNDDTSLEALRNARCRLFTDKTIEDLDVPINAGNRRYTTRLSLKMLNENKHLADKDQLNSCTPIINDSPHQTPFECRYSTRLSLKTDKQHVFVHTHNNDISVNNLPIDGNTSSMEQQLNKPIDDCTSVLRKSTRCRKSTRLSLTRTPKKSAKMTKKKKAKMRENSSVQQKHNEWVLSILNSNTSKELEKLPTVGPKTALIIFNYRRLNGSFNSLEKLRAIQGLPKSYYSRFILANNILF